MLTARPSSAISLAIVLVTALLARFANAEPWLPAGDLALRSDIQILADAGIIKAPVMAWPLRWPDIARDVLADTDSEGYDSWVRSALNRVKRRAQMEMRTGRVTTHVRAAAAENPRLLRTFEDTPRESGKS